jgi:2-polyprenyl-6-methoxyphenol hydroxylase-like FAD-dependent oxidoreductase
MATETFDVVVVGGGIAGNSFATVLARKGRSALVLEREARYRDRVRGEYMQPWGVAEAKRLGLLQTLIAAGGTYHTRFVPYDETLDPADAAAEPIALDAILRDVPGTLGVGHPAACAALGESALAAGAEVRRGASVLEMEFGATPSVTYRWQGVEHTATCRLVVGADGRTSAVRKRAGIELHATRPRLLGAGLLIGGVVDWPDHQVTIGTEDDRVFFILPQGGTRARIYLMWSSNQMQRFAGKNAARSFLDNLALACVPGSESFTLCTAAGPCAVFPMNDTWTDSPARQGVALIGDAAGYSDPHIGQGLSVAMRDVRVLTEALSVTEDWSPDNLRPYAEERAERMRRLRISNDISTTLRGEFGEEARTRRVRSRKLMQAEPELALWRLAALAGPETVPASAFDDSVRGRLCAPGAPGR